MTAPGSAESGFFNIRVLLGVAVLVGLAVFPLTQPRTYYLFVMVMFFTWATLASSWNIVGGYAGYTSLGNSFGFGLGGYTAAVLLRNYGISPFISAPIAGLLAALIGLVIGAISFRVRGPAFLIVTLSIVLAGNVTVLNTPALGSGNGLAFPLLQISPKFYMFPFYYAMLIILVAATLTSWQIKRSKFGLGLMAIREDEERAASMGLNTLAYKSAAFALSIFFAGLVGPMYFYYQGFVFPDNAFFPFNDIRMVATTLVGGRGLFLGPLVGAAILIPMQEFFTTFLGASELNGIALGALIIIVAKCKPDGILGRRPFQLGRWAIQVRGRGGPVSGTTPGTPGGVGVGRSVSEN